MELYKISHFNKCLTTTEITQLSVIEPEISVEVPFKKILLLKANA